MPELPEVETTRLGFVHQIKGATIQHTRLGKPLRWELGCAPDDLKGLTVENVRRRSKYLLIDLIQVPNQKSLSAGMLMVHLGMSGSLRFEKTTPATPTKNNAPEKHEHFTMYTSTGVLRLIDPRRFGAVVYAPAGEQDPTALKLLNHLGPEPLSDTFTPIYLHRALKNRKIPIKTALMDAKIVVGVGNIYANEALFHAGIRPDTPANRIGIVRTTRIHAAIIKVLQAALKAGGSSLRNYASTDGEPGYFQLETRVYARGGQACSTCGKTIRMLRLGQRSCFFCPQCQKR